MPWARPGCAPRPERWSRATAKLGSQIVQGIERAAVEGGARVGWCASCIGAMSLELALAFSTAAIVRLWELEAKGEVRACP